MANANAAKGSRWERQLRDELRARGLRVYRPRQEGFEDVGDLHAGPFVIQAKDWRSWEAAIREGLDGAVRQAEAWDRVSGYPAPSAIRSVPLAVVKRARRPVGEAYAVLQLDDVLRLGLREE